VRQSDAQRWLDKYVESEEYQRRLKDWLEKHPGQRIKMPVLDTQAEQTFLVEELLPKLPKTKRDWLLRKLDHLNREADCRKELDGGGKNPGGFYKPRSLKVIDKYRQEILSELASLTAIEPV